MDICRLHALIQGRVQGIGFRWFVMRLAKPLNVNGWVKNLPDGSVELMVEGSRANLEDLLKDVRRGPSYSDVREIKTEWLEPIGMTGGFDVTY